MDKCDYAMVECPNKCREAYLLRKDLTQHITRKCHNREYECLDCHIKDAYRVITGPHQYVCERKKVECTNKDCDCVLERRLVQDHVAQDCDYTEVSCKYALLGCEKKMIRKDIKTHEADNDGHMCLALTSITDLKNRVLVLESQSRVKSLATIKVSNYSAMRRNNAEYLSTPFFTSPTGYCMRLSVYSSGCMREKDANVGVVLQVLEGPFDSELPWPLTGKFKVELLNQLENKNHCIKLINFAADDDCSQ